MCALPGDVDEDQPLDAGQWHALVVHLQLQLFVQTPGVADLLQTHLHVHTFVMEPEETAEQGLMGNAVPLQTTSE